MTAVLNRPRSAQGGTRRRRPTFGRVLRRALWWIAVLAVAFATVGPLIWTLSTSLKPAGEILSGYLELIPRVPTFDNYVALFEKTPFAQYMLNSAIIATVGTATNVFFGALGGYALAKLHFGGRRAVFAAFLASHDGARRGHDDPDVPRTPVLPAHRRERPVRAGRHGIHQQLRRGDRAVRSGTLRRLLHEAVLRDAARRARRGRAHRRRRRVPDLPEGVLPAGRPGPRRAGGAHLPGGLERVPLAADRAQRSGAVHRAGRPRRRSSTSTRPTTARSWPAPSSRACPCCSSSSSPSATSSRASPPRERSSARPTCCTDRSTDTKENTHDAPPPARIRHRRRRRHRSARPQRLCRAIRRGHRRRSREGRLLGILVG